MEVKLGEWNPREKGWRYVLLDGEDIGEVTKNCIHSIRINVSSMPINTNSYKEAAEYLANLYILRK